MSLKNFLIPWIAERMLSRKRLIKERVRAERARLASGSRHQVHYFHQVDDPYSALACASLPLLSTRHDIDIVPHVVGAPRAEVAPEREKLVAYSRVDAQRLARQWNLRFDDRGGQPSPRAIEQTTAQLVAAIHSGRFIEVAGVLSESLWQNVLRPEDTNGLPLLLEPAPPSVAATHLDESDALRQRLGHYLGATFFYGGEWYWGIDRLHHLDARLSDLGIQRPGVPAPLFPAIPDLKEPVKLSRAPAIDFFFSLRSPYSAIVAQRVFELGRLTGATVNLRYVLPMVMRGLPVPADKRKYISRDAAREAFVRGVPFGRLSDPVGRPTERGLALMPYAIQMGQGQSYVLSFMRGVWAEGIDAGTDRGLRKIVERAGLNWDEACKALKDEGWRKTAEENRAQMFAIGLWGVPSFRVGNTAVWGQDRLWVIEQALLQTEAGSASKIGAREGHSV